VPSPEWPDAIVSVLPNGLDAEAFAAAAAAPGVAPPALPIEASQFPLAPATLEAMKRAGLPEPKSDLILVFGVDPERAFGGPSPLARFRFVEGAPNVLLADARGVIRWRYTGKVPASDFPKIKALIAQLVDGEEGQ